MACLAEKLFEEFFLFVGELVGQVDYVGDEQVAALAVLLEHGHALAFEALHQTWLSNFIATVDFYCVTV